MDIKHATELVDLANARIFSARIKASVPDPPKKIISERPAQIKPTRRKGGGIWIYLGRNAKYYPRREIKF